jgi:hypothetical protein
MRFRQNKARHMKFGIVKPTQRSYDIVDVASFEDALREARLTFGAIDHGTVTIPTEQGAGIGIAVSELSLFVAPASQSYFAIDRRLYAGGAVLYGFDSGGGHTVDVPALPLTIHWLHDGDAAETAIRIGSVIRPVMGHGADVLWRWPEPRPSEAERDAFMARVMARGDTIIIDGDTTLTVVKKE